MQPSKAFDGHVANLHLDTDPVSFASAAKKHELVCQDVCRSQLVAPAAAQWKWLCLWSVDPTHTLVGRRGF